MMALIKLFRLMSSSLLWVCCLSALICALSVRPRDSHAQGPTSTLCLPGTILFVRSAQQPAEGDLPLIVYLMAQGHTVVVRSDAEAQGVDIAAADLVILAAASAPTTFTTQLRDTAVPLLTWAAPLYDDLQLTGPIQDQDYGVLSRQRKVDIVNPDHPLAGGLVGNLKATSSKDTDFAWGAPQQTGVVVATTHQGHARALLFAYEAGVEMVGRIAPARRVAMPSANGLELTDAGWTLFNAAVHWAMACTVGMTPTNTPVLPTNLPTNLPTPLPTGTNTSVPATVTNTPVPPANTPTNTLVPPTPLPTHTQTGGPTGTVTEAATNLPLATYTPTPTATSTPTPSPLPTSTATASATGQPPATNTSTATPSSTPTLSGSETPSTSATPPATGSQLTVAKRDFFFTDADENNQVSPGDTVLYIIQVVNVGVDTTAHLRVEDELDPNTRLISGSVKVIGGVVVQGNEAADEGVTVEIPPLTSGASAAVSLQVRVTTTGSDHQLHNQALVHFITDEGQPSGQPPLLSDDPDTAPPNDATTTPLLDPVAQPSSSLFLPLIRNARPE